MTCWALATLGTEHGPLGLISTSTLDAIAIFRWTIYTSEKTVFDPNRHVYKKNSLKMNAIMFFIFFNDNSLFMLYTLIRMLMK